MTPNELQSGRSRLPALRAAALAVLLAAAPLSHAAAENLPCCRETELTYTHGEITLAGVLLQPEVPGTFPAGVILQGAGDSDRSNSWARLVAETLVSKGMAVLLTDKRGCGRSGGDWWTASFKDLAGDALAGVEALRGRPGIRSDLVGLVGLSQGGHVAPLAATMGEVAFVIDLVGGALPMKETLFHELEQTYRQHGLSESQVEELQRLTELSFAYVETGEGFNDYLAHREHLTRVFGSQATASWPSEPDHRYWTFWRQIHDFDPLPFWREIVDGRGLPAFIGFGELDEHDNVPVVRSVELLTAELEGHSLQIEVYPEVGHSLMADGALHPDLVSDLEAWLLGVTAKASFVAPAWTLAEELCDPETAVYDRERGQLYVSNICDWALDGVGFLSRVGLDGELLEARWIEGLDAPAGMALLGDRLYVADFKRLRVVDLALGQVVESLEREAGALNDVAVAPDGTVYLSDSATHRVLRLDEQGARPFPEDALFTNANGLLWLEDSLWVGGERLWRVDLASGEVVEAGPPGLADIDGIESDGEGGLVVSVVGGPVWHLPAAGEPTVWTTAGLSSTNHLYIPERRLVVVPTGFDDTLVAFRLP